MNDRDRAIEAAKRLRENHKKVHRLMFTDGTGRRWVPESELAARDRALAQLKADHAEMVRRNAVLRTRHDLPVERVKALDSFIAERDAARRELDMAIEFGKAFLDYAWEYTPNSLDEKWEAFLARHAPTNKETE